MAVGNKGQMSWDVILSAISDFTDVIVQSQEATGATDVNGTTWKDLFDGSSLTYHTKVLGFKITKAGTWAGDAKIRIVDGAGSTKLWPFEDEVVEGVDWYSGIYAQFAWEVKAGTDTGYKLQFRSSDAGDGAGETLELDNLDIVELQ